jgi:hypothetical protein
LSALSLMCRTAFIVVTLAVLTMAGARGAQASAAKTHRKVAVASASQATHRQNTSHRARRGISPSAQARTAHKPSANEVGRTAGLAIQKQLAQKQVARGHFAQRSTHARTIRVAEPIRRSRLTSDDYTNRSPESASDLASVAPGPMETEDRGNSDGAEMREALETTAPGASTTAIPREPATQARPQEVEGSGDAESEASEPTEPQQSAGAADAAAGTEVASLRVPRSAMPAPLRGSLASLERQNERLDAEGLERIEDESDLAARIRDKLLVPVPASSALTVNAELPENHRYCRPWTAKFLADLARAHEAAFHQPIEVSSAVRTVEYQKRLMYTNGNAASAEGDVVSPHLTGSTVDIAKGGLNRNEIAWMRRRLLGLQDAGKIDVEEEFQQACFHITVYKSYVSTPVTHLKNGPVKSKDSEPQAPVEAGAQGL